MLLIEAGSAKRVPLPTDLVGGVIDLREFGPTEDEQQKGAKPRAFGFP
jgi:hypothetical protein